MVVMIAMTTTMAVAGDFELCRKYIYETIRDDKTVRELYVQGDIGGAKSFASMFVRDAGYVSIHCSGINNKNGEPGNYLRLLEQTKEVYRRMGVL